MIKKIETGAILFFLVEDGVTAMTDNEKAELMADSFVKVHS